MRYVIALFLYTLFWESYGQSQYGDFLPVDTFYIVKDTSYTIVSLNKKSQSVVSVSSLTDSSGKYIFSGISKQYSQGKLYSERHLTNGKHDGVSLVYHENGLVKEIEQRIDDSVMHVINFYQDGKIKNIGFTKHNRKYGEWRFYHNNGQLARKGEYYILHLKEGDKLEDAVSKKFGYIANSSVNIRIGEWVFYDEQGSEKGKEKYSINDLVDPKEDW